MTMTILHEPTPPQKGASITLDDQPYSPMRLLRAINRAVAEGHLSATQARILVVLVVDYADYDSGSNAYASAATIAARAGYARATVSRHLTQLEEAGWLTISRRQGTSSVYRVASPRPVIEDHTPVTQDHRGVIEDDRGCDRGSHNLDSLPKTNTKTTPRQPARACEREPTPGPARDDAPPSLPPLLEYLNELLGKYDYEPADPILYDQRLAPALAQLDDAEARGYIVETVAKMCSRDRRYSQHTVVRALWEDVDGWVQARQAREELSASGATRPPPSSQRVPQYYESEGYGERLKRALGPPRKGSAKTLTKREARRRVFDKDVRLAHRGLVMAGLVSTDQPVTLAVVEKYGPSMPVRHADEFRDEVAVELGEVA